MAVYLDAPFALQVLSEYQKLGHTFAIAKGKIREKKGYYKQLSASPML